jgi:hypothetical protein
VKVIVKCISEKENRIKKINLTGSGQTQCQVFCENGNIIYFKTGFVEVGGGSKVGNFTKLNNLSGTDFNHDKLIVAQFVNNFTCFYGKPYIYTYICV